MHSPPEYCDEDAELGKEYCAMHLMPEVYVYMVEDSLTLGTLRDYANHRVGANLGGLNITNEVKTWAQTFPVVIKITTLDDDWQHHEFSANGETVMIRVDGRV